ncbi:hypothetical protein ACP70R_025182 [Stipagrostis hirtigluma subsp. patula]
MRSLPGCLRGVVATSPALSTASPTSTCSACARRLLDVGPRPRRTRPHLLPPAPAAAASSPAPPRTPSSPS